MPPWPHAAEGPAPWRWRAACGHGPRWPRSPEPPPNSGWATVLRCHSAGLRLAVEGRPDAPASGSLPATRRDHRHARAFGAHRRGTRTTSPRATHGPQYDRRRRRVGQRMGRRSGEQLDAPDPRGSNLQRSPRPGTGRPDVVVARPVRLRPGAGGGSVVPPGRSRDVRVLRRELDDLLRELPDAGRLVPTAGSTARRSQISQSPVGSYS